jgi:hypothetical protein
VGNQHLEFGAYFASCVEAYKKGRVNGLSKEQGAILALRKAIVDTWVQDSGPWSGSFAHAWKCAGDKPYRNAAGNRAKCPYALTKTWLPEPHPDVCGTCGGSIVTEERWVTDYTKDRYALVRLVAAYCDAQPENPEDGPFAISIGGTPAVELSFQYPIVLRTPDNEPYILCGHLDSVVQFGGERFIDDNKTTTKPLDQKYWAGYSPNTQVDFYDFTGSVLWPDLDIRGVIIEGAQVLKSGEVRMGIGIMRRSEAQRLEFLNDIEYWLQQAEIFATQDYWPMNRRNCWLCEFKDICAKEPDKRKMFLESNFVKRPWNPLEER